MKIETTRFGTVEIDESEYISFPAGLIGLKDDRTYVLLSRKEGSPIGWLQSVTSPWLALPVISAEALVAQYSDEYLQRVIDHARRPGTQDPCAVMLVMNPGAGPGMATVNRVAPIVVNADTRVGLQVLLEDAPDYITTELLAIRKDPPPAVQQNEARRVSESSEVVAFAP